MTAPFVTLVLALCLSLGDEPAAPSEESPPDAPVAETSVTEAPVAVPEVQEVPPPTKPTPGIRKLDRKSRAKVLAALAAFVILWFALIAFIWLGARFTRRYMHGPPRPAGANQDDDDWARKPLVPEGEDEAP